MSLNLEDVLASFIAAKPANDLKRSQDRAERLAGMLSYLVATHHGGKLTLPIDDVGSVINGSSIELIIDGGAGTATVEVLPRGANLTELYAKRAAEGYDMSDFDREVNAHLAPSTPQ